MEAGTGKITLVNTFSRFVVDKIPGNTVAVEAFCQFTDAEGLYDLVIEIRDLNRRNAVLARAVGMAVDVPGRL